MEVNMDMDRVDWDVDFEDDVDEMEFDDEIDSLIELEVQRQYDGRSSG